MNYDLYTAVKKGIENFLIMIGDINPLKWVIQYFFNEMNDKIASLIATLVAGYLIYKVKCFISFILRHNK